MTTDLIARLQAKKRNATEEEDDALAALEAKERENAELKDSLFATEHRLESYIIERDSLAEQNMSLMNALEMLQGSWVEYGLPKTDRSFQISEAALATGGK